MFLFNNDLSLENPRFSNPSHPRASHAQFQASLCALLPSVDKVNPLAQIQVGELQRHVVIEIFFQFNNVILIVLLLVLIFTLVIIFLRIMSKIVYTIYLP